MGGRVECDWALFGVYARAEIAGEGGRANGGLTWGLTCIDFFTGGLSISCALGG